MAQLTQKYVGHITIVPDLRLPELLTFFSNPSEEFCQHAIIMGERSTCKCMSLLVMAEIMWSSVSESYCLISCRHFNDLCSMCNINY